jgi:hypothetical protein
VIFFFDELLKNMNVEFKKTAGKNEEKIALIFSFEFCLKS